MALAQAPTDAPNSTNIGNATDVGNATTIPPPPSFTSAPPTRVPTPAPTYAPTSFRPAPPDRWTPSPVDTDTDRPRSNASVAPPAPTTEPPIGSETPVPMDATPQPPVNFTAPATNEDDDTPTTTSVSFYTVVTVKTVIVQKWWVMLLATMAVVFTCASLAALRKYFESRSATIAYRVYQTVNRNFAIIGVTGAFVLTVSQVVQDSQPLWAFILLWTFYSLFIFSTVIAIGVTFAVVMVLRFVARWVDWEVHIPSNASADPPTPDAHTALISDLRYIVSRQVRLSFPEKKDVMTNFRVTSYIEALDTRLLISLVTFNWKNWLGVAAFSAMNSLRQVAVAGREIETNDQMLIDDLSSFVFALGYLPLVLFAVFYFYLVVSTEKYLDAARDEVDQAFKYHVDLVQKHSQFLQGIMNSGMIDAASMAGIADERRSHLLDLPQGQPIAIEEYLAPDAFRRSGATMAVFRACVLINAAYMAFMLMGMSYTMLTHFSWAPIYFVLSFVPTVAVLLLLPWSSLLLVTTSAIGADLDEETIQYLLRDAPAESVLKRESPDEAEPALLSLPSGPTITAVEGNDEKRDVARRNPLTTGLTEEALDNLRDEQRAKESHGCSNTVVGPSSAELTELLALAVVPGESPLKNPTRGEQLRQTYSDNLVKVQQRIAELEAECQTVNEQIGRTGTRRRTLHGKFDVLVDAMLTRPDLSADWDDRERTLLSARVHATRARLEIARREAALRAHERAKRKAACAAAKASRRKDACNILIPGVARPGGVSSDEGSSDGSEDDRGATLTVPVPTATDVLQCINPFRKLPPPTLPPRTIPLFREGLDNPQEKYLQSKLCAPVIVEDKEGDARREARRAERRAKREEERQQRRALRAVDNAKNELAAVGDADNPNGHVGVGFSDWGAASSDRRDMAEVIEMAAMLHMPEELFVEKYAGDSGKDSETDSKASSHSDIDREDQPALKQRKRERRAKRCIRQQKKRDERLRRENDFSQWGAELPIPTVEELRRMHLPIQSKLKSD